MHICVGKLYEYKGWFFEIAVGGMPWPLKKDGDPRARAGAKFYAMFSEWDKLPNKESFRVGGGCQTIGDAP